MRQAVIEIDRALEILKKENPLATDGKCLESLTVEVAKYIPEWDVKHCWLWADWPNR